MRDIKFRAWDLQTETMYNVIGVDFYVGHIVATKGDPMEHLIELPYDSSDFTILMQYTELKDKNGKEVYDGDIAKFHQFTQELGENLGVREGENEFVATIGFGAAGITVNDEPLFMYYGTHEESIEVIGNIYENPELL